MCVYMCIYIERERDIYVYRKGTNGVGTNGATANHTFFDRETFWGMTGGFALASEGLPEGGRSPIQAGKAAHIYIYIYIYVYIML